MEMAISTQESQVPLLQNLQMPTKTPMQRAIRKTFKGTNRLANLLPTGSVLVFQFLSPIATNQGQCNAIENQYMALALLAFCALTCFLLCFTDSIRDERGKVHHGLATFRGLWVIDGLIKLPPEAAAKYRVRPVDFFHGIVSTFVFAAVALFNENMVKCFFPHPTEEDKKFLETLPVVVGVVSGLLFVAFPSKRHGIGFPLSRH
ncbi:Protein DMP [Dillenia turbinata]|uniref:Protein DMP n=1 Tax=Dillenia turbinata TaxID=194707 RepID=A0AAN8Z0P4_9MAGN